MPLRKIVVGSLMAIALLLVGACAALDHPQFGGIPAGERLTAMQASPNYREGSFQNAAGPTMGGSNSAAILAPIRNLFRSREGLIPAAPIKAVRTDFKTLDRTKDMVVWLGHSSYFIQLAGRRILVDPVLGPNAAPVPGINMAFDGTSIYAPDDMPEIDYLVISHDHYDHLDRASVAALEQKTRFVFSGLGVGAHLERWGFPRSKLREGDWFTSFEPDPGFKVHVLPAHHYSGRKFTRNQTQWASVALEAGGRRLYFSGDSGYGPHFKEISKRLGSFDFVMLDSGQYDPRWAAIHMNPEEVIQAATDLEAKALIPAHVARFRLAWHRWDDPFERLQTASQGRDFRLLTPRIGEPVMVPGEAQTFSAWWRQGSS